MMTTAYVLSGGASLGAIQVGMLAALAERGVAPDLLIGTSAGALNASYLAGHGTAPAVVDGLADVWHGLHTWTLFPPNPRRAIEALLGRSNALFGDAGLRALMSRHLTFADLAEADIPLTVIASDLLSGAEVALDSGSAIEAILASSAIPGMLPPVPWGERTLVDGGLADNTAISRAVRAGADEVYVLPCGYPCTLSTPPRSALGTVMQAMTLLVHQRLLHDIELYTGKVDLVVVPAPCPLSVSPLDFSRAGTLIARAHQEAVKFLSVDGGRREHPAAMVAFHTHEP